MSTPNPTHIDVGAMALLDALRNDETNWLNQRLWDPVTARLHFQHVVSKLTDAGYSIVPNVVLAELVDTDKCSFDHNGGCQAHGHFPPDDQAWMCPVGDAKNILAAAATENAAVNPDETAGQYMHRTGEIPPWFSTAAEGEKP